MRSAQSQVFRNDVPPLHIGRKAVPVEAAVRSRSADDGHAGRKRVENVNTTAHLAVGQWSIERPAEKPHKHRVEGKNSHKSRCPWMPSQLSARQKMQSKRAVDTSGFYREKKFGRGHPEPPQQVAQERREGKRVDPNKMGGTTQSTATSEWHPGRRHTEHRSRSTEAPESHKQMALKYHTTTSLWGPGMDAPAPRTGLRQVRSRSSEGRTSPFATSFDLKPGNNAPVPRVPPLSLPGQQQQQQQQRARPSPHTLPAAGIRSHSANANLVTPYDSSFQPSQAPAHMEAGKRAEFRPRTRIFSAEDSHAKIFGA